MLQIWVGGILQMKDDEDKLLWTYGLETGGPAAYAVCKSREGRTWLFAIQTR